MSRQNEFFRPMIIAWLEGEIAGQPSPVEQVAWQIHYGAQFASIQWALGRIDDAHFEARALYGLNLAFLGLVHEERRPEIWTKLKGLERKLRMSPAGGLVSHLAAAPFMRPNSSASMHTHA